jgi:hypothetical protein
MCNHKKSKITERHFNQFGELKTTKIRCLECGSIETIIEPEK